MSEEFPDYEYDVNQDQEENQANAAAGKTTKYETGPYNHLGY